MMNRRFFFKSALPITVVSVFCTIFAPLSSSVGATWHVKEAPIRFTIGLRGRPTHPSAGYFLHLPDGGILPRPFPLTHVVDANGTELKSYALWQNPETGLGIVFETPGSSGDVYIYVTGSEELNIWTPKSGLTPSALLCADPRHGTMEAAKNLAKLGVVGSSVHFRNRAGGAGAQLCIQGDLSGRPRPCAFYMLAYLDTKDPGKTWIAPLVFSGKSEVRIDNQTIVPKKRIEKSGGTGQWMELSSGLHRLDIFHQCGGSGGWSTKRGVMILTWKTPNTSAEDLGGKRPSDLSSPGTPMWASRHLYRDEIARSGRCTIRKIQSQHGGPVAHFRLQATHNFWFGNESPVLIYKLTAFTAGNPKKTQYTWSFGDEARATGKETSWFFLGRREHKITLTAVSGSKQSQCSIPFYSFTTVRTSMNNPAVREAFITTCLDVFRAYPDDIDPTAAWDKSMWNNFFRNMELGRGHALLAHIFTKRWNSLKGKLSPAKQELLEDLFVSSAQYLDPANTLKWVSRFEKSAATSQRRGMLKLTRAEILMYYLKDLDAARKLIQPMIRASGELAEMAKIRLGDIEFLARDLNEATRLYGEVQNRVKHGQKNAERTGSGLRGGLARSKKELPAQRKRDAKLAARGSYGKSTRVADWKIGAIRDVSASETVRSLIEQGFLMEAKEALRAWEREFPLTKISGNYILMEGKFYMALKDYVRTRSMLEAYCDQIDASSFIPPALKALLQCMMFMNEPDEVLTKYSEAVKKRMEFHPVADEIDALLKIIKTGEVKRESTIDKL